MLRITTTFLTLLSLFCLVIPLSIAKTEASDDDPLVFDDTPLVDDEVHLPEWFSLSFLDLADSLEEAADAGKKGLIIYFGRKDCPYCEAHMKNNWGAKDIVDYTRKHFNVIAIDVRGQRTVTDFDGKTYTEKEYAGKVKTNFTPSFLFYDTQQRLMLKLSGYRPPYQFRAALEYAADGHYLREDFHKYMNRAEKAMGYGQDTLNEHDSFSLPPYNLDRSHFPAEQPLVVFFETPHCHACDVLHGGPMSEPEIPLLLENLDAIQLDTTQDTPVITPAGKKTTAKKWADELKLSFAPTLIFFDENGKEIVRVDSVIQLYRLKYLLQYIQTRGYEKYPTFQLWREHLYLP